MSNETLGWRDRLGGECALAKSEAPAVSYLRSFAFKVLIPGFKCAEFTSVSGLDTTSTIAGTLVLERAVSTDADSDLLLWSGSQKGKDISIMCMDRDANPVVEWKVYDVAPRSYSVGPFVRSGKDVLLERIRCSFGALELVKHEVVKADPEPEPTYAVVLDGIEFPVSELSGLELSIMPVQVNGMKCPGPAFFAPIYFMRPKRSTDLLSDWTNGSIGVADIQVRQYKGKLTRTWNVHGARVINIAENTRDGHTYEMITLACTGWIIVPVITS